MFVYGIKYTANPGLNQQRSNNIKYRYTLINVRYVYIYIKWAYLGILHSIKYPEEWKGYVY